MIHYNPLGWGLSDDSLSSCGKPLKHVHWSGNPDSITCKKCKASANGRLTIPQSDTPGTEIE